jgi:hypothetical protein
MQWKGFLLGLAGGVAIWAVVANSHPQTPKVADDETITFSDKLFYDSASGTDGFDAIVKVTGTLDGNGDKDGPGNKNNTMTILCMKQEGRCEVGSLSQIGHMQADDILLQDWDIAEWSPAEIVAKNVDMCGTGTITISRTTQVVAYVVVPTNLTSPACLKVPNEVHKWTIGRSLAWKRLDPNNTAKIKAP